MTSPNHPNKKYFKTIHGNWVRVLWRGLTSIRIAHLTVNGRTELIKTLNKLSKLHEADKAECIKIGTYLRRKYKNCVKTDILVCINPEKVETTCIPLADFNNLIA